MKKQVSSSEYQQIHVWLNNTFGKAIACENPECEHLSKDFNYALKAGKTHKKLRGNYKTLCKKCHVIYDNQHKNHNHVSNQQTRLSMKLLSQFTSEYLVA